MPSSRSARRRSAACLALSVAAAALVCSLGGCYSPSPGLFQTSTDTFVYVSTSMKPVTITIVDTRTNEPFFHMDIPVGKQLQFNFADASGDDPVLRPAKMTWAVWEAGTQTGSLTNSLSVPPQTARRIDYSLRPAPEMAPQPAEAPLRAVNDPTYVTPAGGPGPKSASGNLYQ
jgi:hypothetical protein